MWVVQAESVVRAAPAELVDPEVWAAPDDLAALEEPVERVELEALVVLAEWVAPAVPEAETACPSCRQGATPGSTIRNIVVARLTEIGRQRTDLAERRVATHLPIGRVTHVSSFNGRAAMWRIATPPQEIAVVTGVMEISAIEAALATAAAATVLGTGTFRGAEAEIATRSAEATKATTGRAPRLAAAVAPQAWVDLEVVVVAPEAAAVEAAVEAAVGGEDKGTALVMVHSGNI